MPNERWLPGDGILDHAYERFKLATPPSGRLSLPKQTRRLKAFDDDPHKASSMSYMRYDEALIFEHEGRHGVLARGLHDGDAIGSEHPSELIVMHLSDYSAKYAREGGLHSFLTERFRRAEQEQLIVICAGRSGRMHFLNNLHSYALRGLVIENLRKCQRDEPDKHPERTYEWRAVDFLTQSIMRLHKLLPPV